MNSWQELLLISAALKTNLLQTIAKEQKTAIELADEFGYDLRAVEIVMEALRELELLKAVRSHYQLTKNASKYIDQNNPDYIANALLHSSRLIANWTKLPEAIKTGRSQSQRRTPQELEIFVRSMDEYSKHYADEAVSLILAESKVAQTALDLGGALGTFSKLFASQGLEVTLVDTEAVASLARKYLKNPSIKIIDGDFTNGISGGPYDVILMSNITHIYNPDKLEALFSRVQEKLSPDGLAAIIDFVRDKSANAAMFGVNMLVHTAGGGTWTLPQYERWLRHSGLRLNKVLDLKNADQKLLIAYKIAGHSFEEGVSPNKNRGTVPKVDSRRKVKPVVDHDLCIGCGLCSEICPQVFELRDDDLAYVIDEEGCPIHGCCEEAADQCPVDAITLEG